MALRAVGIGCAFAFELFQKLFLAFAQVHRGFHEGLNEHVATGFRAQDGHAFVAQPELVASGTPTFPVHAQHEDRICSPGTTVLWDFGYGDGLPDMEFEYAAVLMTRVISKPGNDKVCLDLGHKAVAADKPQPRVRIFGHENAEAVVHSEEHLTMHMPEAGQLAVGDSCYGVPVHICPTVALHDIAWVVKDGKAVQAWEVAARRRSLGV